MSDINSIFIDDPELLKALELKKQTKLLQQLAENKITVITEKGDKGDTPVKGIDYLTPEEINNISNYVKDTVKEEVRPVKGVDYFDGVDGKDGKDGKHGRDGVPGQDGSPDTAIQIADKLNTLNGKVDSKVIKDFPTLENFVKEIKKGKLLELRDIKGARLDMNDQRWHGGGLSSVSHDATLTGQGTPSSPLSVVSSSNFVDNEIVSGSGTSFTLSATPILGSEHIFAARQRLYPTTDYTIAGAVITTVLSWAAGDLLADFRT